MILDIAEERLLVVSDLHLGCPVSSAGAHFPPFIAQAGSDGWSLCINGDGVDLLQGSLPQLGADGLRVVRALREFRERGGRLYYVLGNHDLAIEHFLVDLPFVVSPFLNVQSGNRRIRIEHGHVHEPTYARWPAAYQLGGRLARPLLLANADAYKLWATAQRAIDRRRRRGGDTYPYYVAADALFERGFDVAIFGHTHLPELTPRDGGLFVNGGDWMDEPTYVRIEQGAVTLERWPV